MLGNIKNGWANLGATAAVALAAPGLALAAVPFTARTVHHAGRQRCHRLV